MADYKKKTEELTDVLPAPGKAPFPVNIKPMLAKTADKPFDSEDWLFEIKWDGYRAMGELRNGKARLYSRNNKTLTGNFLPVAEDLQKTGKDIVLDGEIVVTDASGRSDFQLLQNYMREGGHGNLVYYVFDVLYYGGSSLLGLPLIKRREILEKTLLPSGHIRLSEYILSGGIDFFAQAKKNGLEGIMAKKVNSLYLPGNRTNDWLKIKNINMQEAIICGFTGPKNTRKYFGALVLGMYDKGELVFVGHVGGGFDDSTLSQIYAKLKKIIIKKTPFKAEPRTNTPVTWVKPEIVCQVKFSEWTNDGQLRQPVFLGIRADKEPREVRKEKPDELNVSEDPAEHKNGKIEIIDGKKLKLTNLDKVFWPREKYTKKDLVGYYDKIAAVMLPYLKDRPQSLNRHPDGIRGASFYQKNVTNAPEWAGTFLYKYDGEETNYLLCQDRASLVYMANLGCIEIHPWHSRINSLDYPDYAVLDFDPLGVRFEKVIEAVIETHKVLDEAGILNYCKTSGATGMHIYIPLGAKYTYDQAKEFSMVINTIINSRLPETTSLERLPEKRRKAVYLDYLQNIKTKTIAAPYSLRPKDGAPVSTPLLWKEVNVSIDPLDYSIRSIFKRLEKSGDIWDGMLKKSIDMKQSLSNLEKFFRK